MGIKTTLVEQYLKEKLIVFFNVSLCVCVFQIPREDSEREEIQAPV